MCKIFQMTIKYTQIGTFGLKTCHLATLPRQSMSVDLQYLVAKDEHPWRMRLLCSFPNKKENCRST
jgi:hypothetical protein